MSSHVIQKPTLALVSGKSRKMVSKPVGIESQNLLVTGSSTIFTLLILPSLLSTIRQGTRNAKAQLGTALMISMNLVSIVDTVVNYFE